MSGTSISSGDTRTPGTLDLDERGTIVACDDRGAAVFGASPADLIGRDLFREVAPATAVPSFLGLFLAGVRAGAIDETFTFMLGAETGSFELGVTMRDAGEPRRYRVVLDIRRVLGPSRQREAMLAVDQRVRAEPVDPGICEREPIHVPGTIQAHGVLLVADPDDLTIRLASENSTDIFGRRVSDLLGKSLTAMLPEPFVARLRADIRSGALSRGGPSRREVTIGATAKHCDVSVHLHDGRLLLEFEATPDRLEDFGGSSHAMTREAVASLRAAPAFEPLVQDAARFVYDLTGFERVLVYRFDVDWNGEAVAEARAESWDESLLGLRFPASDIPRQARELYTVSPSRFVIDRDASPVPLAAAPAENRPLDMTRALLRSLSPVHLEYQRNLGVNGSMSVAVIADGRLWGLVIGHHRRPHYVAPDTRDAVAVIVDALGLRIQDFATSGRAQAQARHLEAQALLLEEMAGSDDFVRALMSGPIRLTDLFGATGAAVVTGKLATTIGSAPPVPEVMLLAERLRTDPSIAESFATDHLAGFEPRAGSYREVASGMLAAFTDAGRDRILIWFRAEVTSVVVWSGNPNKPVLADSLSAAVLPRRSFERWVEERRGHSERWAPWDVEVAETLARAVEGVALRQSRRIAELSLKQEELLAALKQKDLLTREIDHRVKNSLQIVSAFLSMQSRRVADPAAKQAFTETYGRVMSIARVHDSLYQSEDMAIVDLGQTIENLCRDLAGVGGERHELELKAESGLMVPYRKAVALCLIATELVTNAWKYAYPDKPTGFVEVMVRRHDENGVKMTVCDKGEGLPANWDSSSGRGLGMQLIRSMLNQIEATMEVQSDGGACFIVKC